MDDIVIRAFDAGKDLKEVQMLVGMGAMEQLAIANRIGQSNNHLDPISLDFILYFYSILSPCCNQHLVSDRRCYHPGIASLAERIRAERLAGIFGTIAYLGVYSRSYSIRD
jgi:hypothetical protein